MILFDALKILGGFILLIKGADWLVDGGSSIARRIGISSLVIGLTVVSFGTSAPELLFNISAVLSDSGDLAIGNIVGSNIANTLLILGTTALITPLLVQRSTVFKEIPFCILAACILLIASNDALLDNQSYSILSKSDGLTFLGFFIVFMYYTFGIRHQIHVTEKKEKPLPVWLSIWFIVIGCVGLGIGGPVTVSGAKGIALAFGLSESLIAVSVIAIGTSLPELVTSVVAARKGNSDIAVGNIVGSNIFNIFWILGLSSTLAPIAFDPKWNTDLMVVILSTILLFVFVHTGKLANHKWFRWINKDSEGHVISRIEGGLLLTLYIIYMIYVGFRG